jgi:deazaflavin-dependent oxidoreductase (nitroreductase family)
MERRSLLGLRKRPGRLALAVFRLPLRMYRSGHGRWLLSTFVLFEHVGRITGKSHATVAMVLGLDPASREVIVCSVWGHDTDWIRNLHAAPAREVQIGDESFVPEHRFLSEDESVLVAFDFRHRHPVRLRFLSFVLGWGDLRSDDQLREFVRTRPFVAFRPLSDRRGSAELAHPRGAPSSREVLS